MLDIDLGTLETYVGGDFECLRQSVGNYHCGKTRELEVVQGHYLYLNFEWLVEKIDGLDPRHSYWGVCEVNELGLDLNHWQVRESHGRLVLTERTRKRPRTIVLYPRGWDLVAKPSPIAGEVE